MSPFCFRNNILIVHQNLWNIDKGSSGVLKQRFLRNDLELFISAAAIVKDFLNSWNIKVLTPFSQNLDLSSS